MLSNVNFMVVPSAGIIQIRFYGFRMMFIQSQPAFFASTPTNCGLYHTEREGGTQPASFLFKLSTRRYRSVTLNLPMIEIQNKFMYAQSDGADMHVRVVLLQGEFCDVINGRVY